MIINQAKFGEDFSRIINLSPIFVPLLGLRLEVIAHLLVVALPVIFVFLMEVEDAFLRIAVLLLLILSFRNKGRYRIIKNDLKGLFFNSLYIALKVERGIGNVDFVEVIITGLQSYRQPPRLPPFKHFLELLSSFYLPFDLLEIVFSSDVEAIDEFSLYIFSGL